MSKFRHSLCASCYSILEPGREPAHVLSAEPEFCCRCGELTEDGIYYREDPKKFNHCRHGEAKAWLEEQRVKKERESEESSPPGLAAALSVSAESFSEASVPSPASEACAPATEAVLAENPEPVSSGAGDSSSAAEVSSSFDSSPSSGFDSASSDNSGSC